MRTRRWAAIVMLTMTACSRHEVAPALPYDAANYFNGALRIFPATGSPRAIKLPFQIGDVVFGPQGSSVYGIEQVDLLSPAPKQKVLKVTFEPVKATVVAGIDGFVVRTFAVSQHEDRLVFAGWAYPPMRDSGIFEVLLPGGSVRRILETKVDRDRWSNVSLSPNADFAVVVQDPDMILVDLVHGTAKSFPDKVRKAAWSPNGKWIAMIEEATDRVILLDARSTSTRQTLGSAYGRSLEWSPDSRCLLVWKWYQFHCGIYLDVESPATLELIDIETRRRSVIGSSDCGVVGNETSGWLDQQKSL